MPWCCEPGLFRFISLMPSKTNIVMKAVTQKSAAYRIAKKYASVLLNVPKALFKSWFRFQIKIIRLPFVTVLAVLKLLSWRKSSALEKTSEEKTSPSEEKTSPSPSEEKPSPSEEKTSPSPSDEKTSPSEEKTLTSVQAEPKSEDVVKNVKRLRHSAVMNITHFTGNDLFWDFPILRRKVKAYSEALLEGDRNKIEATKKAILDHGICMPKPESKKEYDRLMEEAKNGSKCFAVDRVPKSSDENVESVDETENDDSSISSDSSPVINDARVADVLGKSKKVTSCPPDNVKIPNVKSNLKCQHDIQLAAQNKLLKNRLAATNNKLEEMLKSSNHILEEVTRLNKQFSRLSTVSIKITSLQKELCEGRKMLREVEKERNEMKHKLLALEKLIKEEEEFLDDLSCESGYEEVENMCDSSCEL